MVAVLDCTSTCRLATRLLTSPVAVDKRMDDVGRGLVQLVNDAAWVVLKNFSQPYQCFPIALPRAGHAPRQFFDGILYIASVQTQKIRPGCEAAIPCCKLRLKLRIICFVFGLFGFDARE